MKSLYPLLVVLLAVFAVAPLGYPGAFQSHTGLLAVYNLIALDQNPAQFFNWAPTVGRAYDLFRTDGALPYLVALLFHRIGFDYLDAIKLVYALAWIASGLAVYALARRFFGEAGALLAATVYVYLPYHIATVYVRGAFAEAVAWAILPLALLAASSKQRAAGSKQQAASSIALFGVLFLVQPGMAILFAPVAFAIVAVLRQFETAPTTTPSRPASAQDQPAQAGFASLLQRLTVARSLMQPLVTIFAGLTVGALLYVPTMLHYGANSARDGFAANYVLPFQLFSSLWGFGVSTGSFLDQFPLQLGVVPIGLAIITVALAWNRRGDPVWSPDQDSHTGLLLQAGARRAVAVFLGVAIVLILLTFEIAAPMWGVLGVLVAYPWQLLAFVGLALALVAGAVVEFDARLARPAMLAFFVALPVVASYNYLAPRFVDFTPTRPQLAIFGDNEIALLDYRIVGPLRHGATVRLHLTWQALRPIYRDYTVFVHAVHADGKTWGQEDSKPQDGALPTIKWTVGQVVSDTHTIQIDVEGPREGYRLVVGLYQAATGARVILDTGADHLILPRPGDPEPVIR